MDLLIILKWVTDWQTIGVGVAPSIINNMINMFLGGGEVVGYELIPGQQTLLQNLLIISVICIPTMLFVKPIWEACSHRKDHHQET